jgi:manganese/iron transport system ATP-binding protein
MSRWVIKYAKHEDDAPAIRLEGVAVHYDGTQALSGVSLSIKPGERAAIVGPNGAGKTTLMQVIVGVLRPSSGTVQVFGHKPGGHVCIAYLPQRSRIDWAFPVTVREVAMMGRIRKIGLLRWPSRNDWRIVDEALERVGLSALHDRRIADLSGGEQQKVFLAQSLAQEAEIVLLDEPFNGLDMPAQENILEILDDLSRARVTAIVATHDLNLAAERFDSVLLLQRRLIAYGTPAEVFTRPNLVQAYGGQVHVLPDGEGLVILTDTCCEGDEAA